jgi:uncharacterized protein YegP (UPF0339 family)
MFEVYRSGVVRRGFRWRFRAENGNIIYASTETYKNFGDCIESIPCPAEVAGASIIDQTGIHSYAR